MYLLCRSGASHSSHRLCVHRTLRKGTENFSGGVPGFICRLASCDVCPTLPSNFEKTFTLGMHLGRQTTSTSSCQKVNLRFVKSPIIREVNADHTAGNTENTQPNTLGPSVPIAIQVENLDIPSLKKKEIGSPSTMDQFYPTSYLRSLLPENKTKV